MKTTIANFKEVETGEAFTMQNHKLLKVELDAVTIQAKLGSMVAYQGDVTFEHAGSGGMGKMLKKAVTGEGQPAHEDHRHRRGLPRRRGAGHPPDLPRGRLQITVNGRNVLAFDAGIDWDIKKTQGGASAVMAGGLFNMELRGTGWVALLSDGPPVLLNVAEAPTFADAQAAIVWSSGVTTAMKTDFKMKNLVGRGSGEALQVAFGGEGWVLVQPSEGIPSIAQSGGGGGALGNILGG